MNAADDREWLIRHSLDAYDGDGDRLAAQVRAALDMDQALARVMHLRLDPDDPRHGTYTGYSKGCRCDRCKLVYKRYNAERRPRIPKVREQMPERACEVCGDMFTPSRLTQRRCRACIEARPNVDTDTQRRIYQRTGSRS